MSLQCWQELWGSSLACRCSRQPWEPFSKVAQPSVLVLQVNDLVQKIDGKAIEGWGDLVKVVAANPERELSFRVLRAGEILTVRITPEPIRIEDQTYWPGWHSKSAGDRPGGPLGAGSVRPSCRRHARG